MSARDCAAPPRRKSCAECIRAKRRCDLERPKCMRCTRQSLECDYGTARPSKRMHSDEANTPASQNDGLMSNAVTTITTPAEAPLPYNSIDDILELPIDVEDFINTAMVSGIMDKSALQLPRQVHMVMEPLNLENLPTIIERRVSYAIEQIKSVPQMFAEQCQMPWCHGTLYGEDMPSSMREAQAACALYALKNDTNSRSVWRNIEGRAEQLFTSKRPEHPFESLAYTQAMLLYQIMRFFGGDFAERCKADVAMQQLEDAAYGLYSTVDLSTDLSTVLTLYPTAESMAVWRTWTFEESQRRTFAACFMFISVCHLLKAQIGYCAEHAALLCAFTASAHLWEAKNVFDFTMAWQKHKHYVVRQFDFTEIIAEAKADDVDVFGRMLLCGAMGIDDFKGWLYTRGGSL